MSTKAATAIGLPPGLNFHPDDDELIEFFLLPTVRGEPAWFPGVIVIGDDTAANTLPWKLLKRHGLAGDDEAYFFVRTKQDDDDDSGSLLRRRREVGVAEARVRRLVHRRREDRVEKDQPEPADGPR